MRTICIIKEMINANKFKLRDIMRFNINKLKKKVYAQEENMTRKKRYTLQEKVVKDIKLKVSKKERIRRRNTKLKPLGKKR